MDTFAVATALMDLYGGDPEVSWEMASQLVKEYDDPQALFLDLNKLIDRHDDMSEQHTRALRESRSASNR